MTNTCINCQNPLKQDLSFADIFAWRSLDQEMICQDCKAQFEQVDPETSCPHCSKKNGGGLCSDCQDWLKTYPEIKGSHRSLYHYNDFAKEWMAQFKMRGDVRYGLVFGKTLKALIEKDYLDHVIVPVPSSAKSLKDRGFNQIDVILSVLQMEYTHLLENTSQGQKQSQKSRADRLQTSQPFSLVPGYDIRGLKLLIIDDIYTTGRTLHHIKALLHSHGAIQIDSLSLFR